MSLCDEVQRNYIPCCQEQAIFNSKSFRLGSQTKLFSFSVFDLNQCEFQPQKHPLAKGCFLEFAKGCF